MAGTVTVTAAASVTARPDRAVVELVVSALRPTAEEAIDDVAARSGELAALLDDLGISAADRRTSALTLGQEHEWQDNRQVLVGFRATSQTSVQLADVDVLGRLLRQAVERAGAGLHGPTWVVDPTNPARAEAYRRATELARARADASAGALGLRLGDVVEITDTPRAQPPLPMPRMAMAAEAAGDRGTVPVEAGDVVVSAVVTVTFGLLSSG